MRSTEVIKKKKRNKQTNKQNVQSRRKINTLAYLNVNYAPRISYNNCYCRYFDALKTEMFGFRRTAAIKRTESRKRAFLLCQNPVVVDAGV